MHDGIGVSGETLLIIMLLPLEIRLTGCVLHLKKKFARRVSSRERGMNSFLAGVDTRPSQVDDSPRDVYKNTLQGNDVG